MAQADCKAGNLTLNRYEKDQKEKIFYPLPQSFMGGNKIHKCEKAENYSGLFDVQNQCRQGYGM